MFRSRGGFDDDYMNALFNREDKLNLLELKRNA